MPLAGMCLAILVGATLHRVAGIGLGMVVAPVLTLLLGPATGVTLSNAAAVVTSLLVLAALRADVDWRHYLRLAPLILVGSVAGAATVRSIGSAWLDVLVGGSLLLTLAASVLLRRDVPVRGRTAAVSVGVASGFLNTTCGVAAPALTAYALATRWEHRSFAATLQPILLTANLASLVTKGVSGTELAWWVWPVAALAVCAGVAMGSRVAGVLPTRVAAATAVTVATTGAALALVRGLLAL